MLNKSVEIMLNNFLEKEKSIKKEDIEIWYFGNNEKMAKELGNLVLKGKKTATSSDYILYKNDEELPKKNSYHLVTDFYGEAICIIKIEDVELIPFNEMTEIHSKLEGEGDLSYEYWYKVHKKFFSEERKKENIEFLENMIVVFETFKVVFK